ncbi:DUF805 domain-containing protein [Tabrizicola sp.]|uniref:DUF805 domain-containing protein n=1 Tax=Tabrizicola sp. TaxID=2005166 RepID=UPI00286CEAA3|nr:DUF805 domain-containing protein [Tabrizicola sp.]
MGSAQAIKTCLAKSFQFSGPASRSEFWWFLLFTFAVYAILFFAVDLRLLQMDIDGDFAFLPFADTFLLLTLPASAAVTARRLQDRNIPGTAGATLVIAVVILGFAPLLTDVDRFHWFYSFETALIIVNLGVLILCALPSTPGFNRYGPNPNEVPQ